MHKCAPINNKECTAQHNNPARHCDPSCRHDEWAEKSSGFAPQQMG